MKRILTASYDQIQEVGGLIDLLGAGVYRDAKRAAGVKWSDPFTRLYRIDAETIIGIMKEKAKE